MKLNTFLTLTLFSKFLIQLQWTDETLATHQTKFHILIEKNNVQTKLMNMTVVSSLRQVIKPGYGLAPRSHTFSSATTTGSTHIGVPVSFSASLSRFTIIHTYTQCYPSTHILNQSKVMKIMKIVSIESSSTSNFDSRYFASTHYTILSDSIDEGEINSLCPLLIIFIALIVWLSTEGFRQKVYSERKIFQTRLLVCIQFLIFVRSTEQRSVLLDRIIEILYNLEVLFYIFPFFGFTIWR